MVKFKTKKKWGHLVAKFRTNTSGANWWSNLELIQVAPPGIPVYCLLLDSSEHREQHDYCNSRDTLLIRRCPLFQQGQSQGRLHTGYEEETNEFWDQFSSSKNNEIIYHIILDLYIYIEHCNNMMQNG